MAPALAYAFNSEADANAISCKRPDKLALYKKFWQFGCFSFFFQLCLSCLMTKQTKWHVHPAKTQISLGIRLKLSRITRKPLFTVRIEKYWVLSYPLSALRRLIKLGGCPGWSESFLGTQSFCWFCHEVAHFSYIRLTNGWLWRLLWTETQLKFAKNLTSNGNQRVELKLSRITRKPLFGVLRPGKIQTGLLSYKC